MIWVLLQSESPWQQRQDNKASILVGSCPAHDVAPHWSFTPPKELSAIVNYPENRSLSRILNTPDEKHKKFPQNRRRIGWELGPVPTLSKSKMVGQLIWYNNCIISTQGFVWVIFFKKATKAFCCPALLTVDRWFHFLSSKGLGKLEVTLILLTEARICLYLNLRMYGYAPLLMGIYNNYSSY